MKKEMVFSPNAPKPVGAYNHGVICQGILYTAGQIALDPVTNELVKGGAKEEATQIMKNLGSILEAAGTNYDNLLKATIYLTDLNDFATVDQVYKEFVTKNPPGRTCVEVTAIPKGGKVEMEMIACI